MLLDRVDDIVDADIDDIPMLMYDIVADIDDILMLMYDIVDDVDIWIHGDVRSNMLLSHPLTKDAPHVLAHLSPRHELRGVSTISSQSVRCAQTMLSTQPKK